MTHGISLPHRHLFDSRSAIDCCWRTSARRAIFAYPPHVHMGRVRQLCPEKAVTEISDARGARRDACQTVLRRHIENLVK